MSAFCALTHTPHLGTLPVPPLKRNKNQRHTTEPRLSQGTICCALGTFAPPIAVVRSCAFRLCASLLRSAPAAFAFALCTCSFRICTPLLRLSPLRFSPVPFTSALGSCAFASATLLEGVSLPAWLSHVPAHIAPAHRSCLPPRIRSWTRTRTTRCAAPSWLPKKFGDQTWVAQSLHIPLAKRAHDKSCARLCDQTSIYWCALTWMGS